jgi:hypothetical protein
MLLSEAIDYCLSRDDHLTICAMKPWTHSSDAVLVKPNSLGGIPEDTKKAGYLYFLEASVVKEIVEGAFDRINVGEKYKYGLVIHYAENDGFPHWDYDAIKRGSDVKI